MLAKGEQVFCISGLISCLNTARMVDDNCGSYSLKVLLTFNFVSSLR